MSSIVVGADSKGSVLCAMSGGVDSSASAMLLKEEGYRVVGVTMRLFEQDGCAQRADGHDQAALDARAVCDRLGIEHEVCDFRSIFDDSVVEPFCRSYLAGLTPNPCIECNKALKFGAFHDLRKLKGLDFVATGHYVRRRFNEETARFELLRGQDPKKDQSYVLYHLTQDHLAHMLFPVGDITKDKTRSYAAQSGLSVADKPESQDICFIPDGDYVGFIERRIGRALEPGAIVDREGNRLGTHQGLARYTLGQRKGLGVAVGEPLFVLGKNVARNELVVGTASETGVSRIDAADISFISGMAPTGEIEVEAKTNYRGLPRKARAHVEGDRLVVELEEPIRSVAPGQAVVLYQGDIVLGGGTIVSFG